MRNVQTIPNFIITFAPKHFTYMKMRNIFMKMKNILILLFVVFAVSANSQTRSRKVQPMEVDTVPELVKNYMDSLQNKRVAIDSVFAANDSLQPSELDGKYYRFFVPLTFYHNVIGSMFSMSEQAGNQLQNQTLLDVYMQRPDLVSGTQSQLDHAGPLIQPREETVEHDVDIVSMVSPKVNEEHIDTPINIYVEKPNFWNFSGDYNLQLFQNYISDNWYKGGESNYSLLGTLTLQANYNNKQRFRWDNKLEMRLGFQNSRGDTLHTVRASEDLLRYTGKVGLQATKNWYYSLQLIASTQFMRGLKSNDPNVYSTFLAPLYLTPSVGMDYTINWFKGKLRGSAHLAPLAYKLTYVSDKKLSTRFGLEADRHVKNDFGSEVTIDFNWQLAKDVKWKTRLYAYTTYKRMLMEWENTFTFVVNKYISSNLFLYPRFDDGAARDNKLGYWQLKEYISLGFSYGF